MDHTQISCGLYAMGMRCGTGSGLGLDREGPWYGWIKGGSVRIRDPVWISTDQCGSARIGPTDVQVSHDG